MKRTIPVILVSNFKAVLQHSFVLNRKWYHFNTVSNYPVWKGNITHPYILVDSLFVNPGCSGGIVSPQMQRPSQANKNCISIESNGLINRKERTNEQTLMFIINA